MNEFLIGAMLAAFAGSGYSFRNILSQKITKHIQPKELTSLQFSFAFIIFLIISAFKPPVIREGIDLLILILIVIVVGIAIGVALRMQYSVYSRNSYSYSAITYELVPVITAVFALLLLDEHLKFYDWIGIFATITGVVLLRVKLTHGLKLPNLSELLSALNLFAKDKYSWIIVINILLFSLITIVNKYTLSYLSPLTLVTGIYLVAALLYSKDTFNIFRNKTQILYKLRYQVILFIFFGTAATLASITSLSMIPTGISSALMSSSLPIFVLSTTIYNKEAGWKKKLIASGIVSSGVAIISIF